MKESNGFFSYFNFRGKNDIFVSQQFLGNDPTSQQNEHIAATSSSKDNQLCSPEELYISMTAILNGSIKHLKLTLRADRIHTQIKEINLIFICLVMRILPPF